MQASHRQSKDRRVARDRPRLERRLRQKPAFFVDNPITLPQLSSFSSKKNIFHETHDCYEGDEYELPAAPRILLCIFDPKRDADCSLLAGGAPAEESLCAEVKLEIAQGLTLERQAFEAHMRIKNGLKHISLDELSVTVNFADENGNPIEASSDPDNTSAQFFIRLDSIEHLANVQEDANNLDSNGTVNPSSTADIYWLIIPAPGASEGIESGKLYYVGATLRYNMSGEEHVTEISPDYIFVKPMPQLRLDYFLPREVVGDDAFTDEIEEPIPYTLGLRAGNFGSGTAHQVAISSAQPEILENDQGLKIEFAIDNSEVNGEPATPNLLAELGDIPPQAAGVARWNMRCSLSGYFDEFSAELSHADDLGGELTALIKQENVFTHTLIHDVLVELPGRDSIRDFLVTDDPTATAPDYTVFESEYQDHEVPELSDTAELTPLPDEPNRFILSFSTPPSSTCLCVTLPDPGNGAQPLKEVSRTDAAGQSYAYEYNDDGQLVRQTDPSGKSQRYEYDEQGRLHKSIDGSGNAIVREYSAVPSSGSSSSCSSCSGGLFSSSESDSMERLTRISYPTFTKEFRYDSDGRVSDEVYSFTGGQSITTSYNYDAFGRVQSISGPGGSVSYAYDAMGQKIAVSDPSGTTSFAYDDWGNLQSLTDAAGQMTRFDYDNAGKLLHEIRPLNQQTSFDYDPQGRLDTITDAKLQVTDYGYDDQSRLETIAYADGRSVTLSYDADGNLAGYDDGVTSATYEYDALGRKTKETVDYGSFSKSFSYSYAANGLKSSFTAPDGTVYEYSYGDNNELREISIPNLGAISFADYQWTRPARIVYPGGSTREMDYDGLMRLTQLTSTTAGGNVLLDYSYEYDNSGNIMSKNTEHGEYSYGYDSASRLTGAEHPILDDESYAYDEVGNRTSASNAEGEIAHNANNELERYGELEYEYDDNGNMTEVILSGQVVFVYHYNDDNRLVKVEGGNNNTIAEYYYDPFGRRLWKDANQTRTYFFYSDEGLVAEFDVSGSEVRSYGYQPDSTWSTDPLWMRYNNAYYFYQNDHLGTPQKLTAQNGMLVWSATYSTFGEASVDIETVKNNLRFPGQYYDAETGLHYNGNRYYDPRVGRYMSVDPIGFVGGDNNLYAYANSNPLNQFDHLGMASFRDIQAHELFYTWHMGWIDEKHALRNAGEASLRKAWKKMKNASDGENIDFYLMLIQPLKSLRADFCVKVAPKDPNHADPFIHRKNQLLYAWKTITMQFEEFQGQFPQNLEPFNMLAHMDLYETPSSFSTEDLISNLIFFYSIVNGKNAETLVNTYAGRFTPLSEDERVLSEAIWLFSLHPRPGHKLWEPKYFKHDEFLKIDFRKLLSMRKSPSCCTYNAFEVGLRAQQILPAYIAKFGPRKFPVYFQTYMGMSEGVTLLKQINKWEWNI